MKMREKTLGIPMKAALALSLLALGLLATSALAQTVRLGNLIVTIEGDFSPKALPKKEKAPITLKVSGSLKTADATHPPALKTLFLEFDRNGELNTKGLPTCKVGQLQSTITAQAKRACGDALVGTGKAEAEIAFPEQAPFSASGPMLIFNGAPKGGKRVLIIHVYAFVPAPTTFVTTALIGKASGKYGTTASIEVPTIVAGQGSLIAFNATVRKTWSHKGKKQSLLLASCPTGHLYAKGDFTFSDGQRLTGTVSRSCTPKG
jgi:hypothetical protein